MARNVWFCTIADHDGLRNLILKHILFPTPIKGVKPAVWWGRFYNIPRSVGCQPTTTEAGHKERFTTMANKKEDIRPDQAKPVAEHADREGATTYSGHQPNSVFANQGSTAEETAITKNQRS
jgi:hypothetical protein